MRMSEWHSVDFAPQGWQCPICGAVYSPMTMACMNCTGWRVSNNMEINRKKWENIVDKVIGNDSESETIVKARKELFMGLFDDSQEGR